MYILNYIYICIQYIRSINIYYIYKYIYIYIHNIYTHPCTLKTIDWAPERAHHPLKVARGEAFGRRSCKFRPLPSNLSEGPRRLSKHEQKSWPGGQKML